MRSMFGMGMGEILLIAVVALLVVGPDRLPATAKAIGKGIRDLRASTKDLQSTIEQDTQIGDAVRELKGALRGDPETLYKRATGEDFNAPANGAAASSEDASKAGSKEESDNSQNLEPGEAAFPRDPLGSDALADSESESNVPGGDAELGALLDEAYANSNDPWGSEAVNPHLDEAAAEDTVAASPDPDLPVIKQPAGSVARMSPSDDRPEGASGVSETDIDSDTSSHG